MFQSSRIASGNVRWHALSACSPSWSDVASFGNEDPDWEIEVGVRRPIGRIFARYENYGLAPFLSKGPLFVAGVGMNL